MFTQRPARPLGRGRIVPLGVAMLSTAALLGGSVGIVDAEETPRQVQATAKLASGPLTEKSPPSSEMRAAPVATNDLSPEQIADRFTALWAEVEAARDARTTARRAYGAANPSPTTTTFDLSLGISATPFTAPVDPLEEQLNAAEALYRRALGAYLDLAVDVSEFRSLRRTVESSDVNAAEPLTVLGQSTLTADQLVGWFSQTYRISSTRIGPVADIAALYVSIGNEIGVRGDIAFVQASHETGQFSSGHARRFNMAGIGAYDSCSPGCGLTFRTLPDGVRGHLSLMHDYSSSFVKLSSLSSPDLAGCCTTWLQLSRKWATNPRYAVTIFGEYRDALDVALTDRVLPGDPIESFSAARN